MSAAQIVHGAHRGRVSSTADPAGRRRLRLVIPDVFGSTTTGWAEPSTTRTVASVPAVGDLVYVIFEAGCPEYPVWLDASSVSAPRGFAADVGALDVGIPASIAHGLGTGDVLVSVKATTTGALVPPSDTLTIAVDATAVTLTSTLSIPAATWRVLVVPVR